MRTATETAEETLARLTRKLRRWESYLAANERHHLTDRPGVGVIRNRARLDRAQLDIVRDVLEEIGERPAL
jgi:hypothetical protein